MISVAILGAGIGAEHLAAYRRLPEDFQVTWLIDQDTGRAASLLRGDACGINPDIDTALADPQIDLIDICLPPHLHVPVALRALAAGKHVICEKPLATSMQDVDALRRASSDANRQVFPVFQYRWGPALAKLRALTECGFAGKPQVASIETHWSRGADYYAVPWRGTWAGEQGGAVLGHAIHNHDLMTQFMGPVSEVTAFTATRVNPIETEDCAALCFRMQNGSLVTSSVTLGAAVDETRIRVVFENMTATSDTAPYAPGAADWTFAAREPDRQAELDTIVSNANAEATGFEGFLSEVGLALSGSKNRAVTLAEGAASVELVTAIYQAARSGQPVKLPLTKTHPLYGGWHP
ncbi:Gfo/Idh/MocA family oxidoreductase [uncultured Roseobacter sp.]|uniref:Gfo/Idh/MocA family protein n=1 Tax=uncultured Roseobacter sp. TaxID=114847 RepID=UPI002601E7E7|nr:Gfo/Idh/MocA family oxidoreductase [uncultured Roseobacter sp.]